MKLDMKRVKISILNNDYFIKTDADEEYLHQIALYLEEKIKEVSSQQVVSMDIPRPFLLATLRIADDYLRLKREFEEFRSRAEERTRKLVEILEKAELCEDFDLRSEDNSGEKGDLYGKLSE